MGRAPAKPLDEAIVRWLDIDAAHLKSYRQILGHVRAIRHLTAGRQLTDVVEVAEAVITEGRQADRKWKAATINRRLAILRRVANRAYRTWGWLDEPLADRIPTLSGEEHRHVYLSPAQVEEIAGLCRRRDVADMIRLAAYTGLRRSELLRLDPARHVQGDLIVLDAQTKSGRPRVVPILPRIAGAMARLPYPGRPSTLDKWWMRARDAAGYPGVRFHDLRHTYASWLAARGVDPTAMRDLLGHASLSVTSRYAHLQADRLREAAGTLQGSRRKSVAKGDGGAA
jgi:integrase